MRALVRWVSLRHLLGEWPRTLLAVAGVTLGVAVFVAIRAASHSALASFTDTVDVVAGRANLEVRGGSEGFDETLYPRVRATPGVQAAAPVVEQTVPARAGPPPKVEAYDAGERGPWTETILVLGIDVFEERPFARLTASAAGRDDLLSFLADRRAVAITASLARRDSLALGDTLTLLVSGRPVPMRVRRILGGPGSERAFGGDVAVVDIATAQELFGRMGRLDRIDLIVDPRRRDEVAARLAAASPRDVEVGSARGRTRQVENMVRAFRLNLEALSFIALFVAAFLIHDAVSTAVARRRQEIGILRALGVARAGVTALFVGESLLLGLAGAMAGLALGGLLARGTLGAVSRTLTDLYLVRQAATLRLDPGTIALGLALGPVVALATGWAPARDAARTPPSRTLREGDAVVPRRRSILRLAAAGGGLLVAAAALSWGTVKAGQPYGGFVAAFLVLAGFACLAPTAIVGLERAAEGPLRALGGIAAVLGARDLGRSVARTSVAAAALMTAVGMLVALTIMVGSFRRTVDTWVDQTVRGDLYVEPVGHRVTFSATSLPPALVEAVRRIPEIAAVDTYRGSRFVLDGRPAFVAGVDFEVQRHHGRLAFVKGDAAAILARARAADGAVVSESFARHHGVRVGDRIALPAPGGPERLPVMGTFYDYSTDAGVVLVDRGLYARLWRDPRVESLALFLRPGADVERARRAVIAAAGDSLVLSVIPNRSLRARVLTVFDQTFQITWALQGIAVLVAVLGVAGTLTTLILQRAREIAMLRAAGALRRQIRVMVLAESGLLGLAGALLGCLAGIALSLLLVHVIHRQFFGWTIRLTLDPWVFVRTVALIVAAALGAGLAPARWAASRVTAVALREE